MRVSVIIPTYNEEKVIKDCLESLKKQTFKDMEIIVVDDGSTDKTIQVLSELRITRPAFGGKNYELRILRQNHKGTGLARNLGTEHSNGDILVFVDSDMTFDKKFIQMLIKPILSGKTIGTFSKEEFVLNKDNNWSKCWNINKGLPLDRMHPKNYPNEQKVFRAILKKEFDQVGGFSSIGYVDDYTLSEKLGKLAKAAPNAIFYHKNPETLMEVFNQARWIGKSEYKRRKINNENIMRFISIIRYLFPLSFIYGFIGLVKYGIPRYLPFKIVYDFAIEISLLKSLIGEQKYK